MTERGRILLFSIGIMAVVSLSTAAIAIYVLYEAGFGVYDARLKEVVQSRARIIEGLNAIDGIRCGTPEGAFYAFADVRELVGKTGPKGVIEDDLALAGYLLDEARCAVVPGTAFGAPGHLRISYAASEEQIDEGLRRIAAATAKLS